MGLAGLCWLASSPEPEVALRHGPIPTCAPPWLIPVTMVPAPNTALGSPSWHKPASASPPPDLVYLFFSPVRVFEEGGAQR